MALADDDARRTSFGAAVDADRYDAARPGYPAAAAAWLVGGAGAARTGPLRVLDLAAGTGKLTLAVLDLGHDVVAVDPSEAMLAALERSVARARGSARTTTAVGSAEQLPLPDASVDAVVVGQGWHWVRPAAAAAEVARVLRPGGTLGLVWNERDTAVAWVAELEAVLATVESRSATEGAGDEQWWPRVPPPLEGRERAAFRSDQRMAGPQALVDLAATYSAVALSPERDAVLARVRALAEAAAEPDGSLVLAQVAHAFRYRRP